MQKMRKHEKLYEIKKIKRIKSYKIIDDKYNSCKVIIKTS